MADGVCKGFYPWVIGRSQHLNRFFDLSTSFQIKKQVGSFIGCEAFLKVQIGLHKSKQVKIGAKSCYVTHKKIATWWQQSERRLSQPSTDKNFLVFIFCSFIFLVVFIYEVLFIFEVGFIFEVVIIFEVGFIFEVVIIFEVIFIFRFSSFLRSSSFFM